MKILIHGINFSPELVGIGKYSGEMAEWLSRQGHEIRVVTAPPYYPQWRVADDYKNKWLKDETSLAEATKSNLQVYRCPLWVPNKLSGAKRLLHLASFAASSFPVMLSQIFWKPDLVLIIAPALFCAPQAWLTARLCGAKAWLHIQDFEVDVAFDMGLLRSSALKPWILMTERGLLRGFDRVSTISDKMLEKLADKGITPERRFLFSNWVDLEAIHPLPKAPPLRSELNILPEQTVALYSGNIGEKVGLEVVLEAAALLREKPNLLFVLCGDGAAKSALRQRYDNLANVRWLPLQPPERLNELLNLADLHLLPQRHDVADLVMPSKLLGMLASARPVLSTASPDSQIGRIVSQCGTLVPTANPHQFANALISLAADPEHCQSLGKTGRQIAERQFSKTAVLGNFEHELQKLCNA